MMKKKRVIETKPPRVIRGGGNVFADLGFKPADSAEFQVKAELARQIHNCVKELGLTQVDAAARLELSQPDVSKLMNGRYTGYSTAMMTLLCPPLQAANWAG